MGVWIAFTVSVGIICLVLIGLLPFAFPKDRYGSSKAHTLVLAGGLLSGSLCSWLLIACHILYKLGTGWFFRFVLLIIAGIFMLSSIVMILVGTFVLVPKARRQMEERGSNKGVST
jgi:hypothetical protein